MGSSNFLDKPPRLATARQIRDEKKMRDELSGERSKANIKKVSLPKLDWGKS